MLAFRVFSFFVVVALVIVTVYWLLQHRARVASERVKKFERDEAKIADKKIEKMNKEEK